MATKRRPWPAKRRQKQAENCLKNKPWEGSTGPKTDAGKARVALNACKHGLHSAAYAAEIAALRQALEAQSQWLARFTSRQALSKWPDYPHES